PSRLTRNANPERTAPKRAIEAVICKLPTPAALIAVSSLSDCIFASPITVPTRIAIGQVNATTFGIKATVNCHTRLAGRSTLKKMSENRLACCTNRTTLSSSHEETKYGSTAMIKYFDISQPCRVIQFVCVDY